MGLKELLGDAYKDGMSIDEIDTALSGKKLVDLESGEYVSKGKLTDALNKVKLAEDKAQKISQEYTDFKNSKMTDEEKANEKAKEDAETLNAIMEENRKYKLKDQLYDSGYTKDEVKQLLEADMSPEAFAKISTARVEAALKKDTAKGIKDTTVTPPAENGKKDTDNGNLLDAMREKYIK